MRKIIFGPPMAGKGTAASRVAPLRNIPHISTGDLFRYNIKNQTHIGIQAQKFMDKGELVPDEIVIEMLRERIAMDDCKKGFILDGFPRTIKQAEMLKNIIDVDMVINLVVPNEILIQRGATRQFCTECGEGYNTRGIPTKQQEICDKCSGKVSRRSDDEPEIIKKRLQTYKEQTEPLIDFYKNLGVLHNIITNELGETPQQLVDKVMEIIKKLEEEYGD